MKRLLIMILVVLPLLGDTTVCYARKEGQQYIDSLTLQLKKQAEDTNKVKLLNELSYHYHPINPDEGIKYGQAALELATKLGWTPGIARANQVLGNNHLRKSDNPEALIYYQEALKIFEETDNKKGIASATNNIGLLFFSEHNDAKALEYYFKALKMHEQIGNKDGIAIVCDNVGDVMRAQDNYPQALEYYLRSLKMSKELGKTSGIAAAIQSIGEIYAHQKKYVLGIACMQKAIQTDSAIGDKLGVAWGLTNIGRTYLAMAGDTAVRYVNDTGDVLDVKKYLAEQVSQPRGPGLRNKAIAYLQQGLTKGIELHAQDALQACYKSIAEASMLTGNYKKAREYYIDYTEVKDSVFSKENSEKIVRIEYANIHFYDSLKTAQAKKLAGLELTHQRNFTYAGLVTIVLLLGFSFFIIKERGKSEKLLLNILPAKVAEELKSKGIAKASQFDNVTLLFTDFVNFTNASEQMGPQALIDELHSCFKAFDEITTKYSIEKIKTIGDAYIAAAGLPSPDPRHAENAIKAAAEIKAFMNDRRTKLNDKTFEIRIGVHTGSVVAGIVGIKKFAYDIWGDTVNIAAEMEQNSKAGKINISEATYELVKDKFTCEYRGETEARNRGALKMYFVS